jgi:hypothetical protein
MTAAVAGTRPVIGGWVTAFASPSRMRKCRSGAAIRARRQRNVLRIRTLSPRAACGRNQRASSTSARLGGGGGRRLPFDAAGRGWGLVTGRHSGPERASAVAGKRTYVLGHNLGVGCWAGRWVVGVFEDLHRDRIHGSLAMYDRMIFKGRLTGLYKQNGAKCFCGLREWR